MNQSKNIKGKSQKKATLAIDRLVEDYASLKRIIINSEASSELMKAKIKKFMGNKEVLIGIDGSALCSYITAKPFQKTDWQAVALELKASDELIKKHSKTVSLRPLIQIIK